MKNNRLRIILVMITILAINQIVQQGFSSLLINQSDVDNDNTTHYNHQRHFPLDVSNKITSFSSINEITAFIDLDPILILNNTAFGPSGYNFPGYGNETHPFLIENYNLTHSTNHLIEIRNTNVFFEINNNTLDGINWNYKGILFANVTHGTISGNTINNNMQGISLESYANNNLITGNSINFHNEGIELSTSNTNIISNNTFYHNIYGIYLWSSNYNAIYDNAVYENYDGIKLDDSDNNQIYDNYIHDNEGESIWLESADSNIVKFNAIINSGTITNSKNGIFLSSNSKNNFISENDISNSSFSGISLIDSTFNTTIENNHLYNNSRFGIWVDNLANLNNFINNTILNNSDYGLAFDSATSNNYVTRNRFINNAQLMTSQAWDVGSGNIFFSNYWNEWTSPDMNLDGFVDIPYLIDGSVDRHDLSPLVFGYDIRETTYYDLTFNQNDSFIIEKGEKITFWQCSVSADNNIAFSGEGTLKIIRSNFYHLLISGDLNVIIIDSTIAYTEIAGQGIAKYENVILQQFFASDNSTNLLIESHITQLFDGSPIPGSGHSSTMVKAAGFSRILMLPYSNTGHWGGSPAGIIWKIGKSTFNKTDSLVYLEDIVDLEFYIEGFNPNPNLNSKNISIRFYVGEILEGAMLCESNAENWNWHVNYQFNTSKYPKGLYRLKLVINDSTVENQIIYPFFIYNIDHIISEPAIVSPNGGETLSSSVTIQWLAATDSLNHPVTYSLLHSSDSGNHWHTIASGLTDTVYIWDTTSLESGSKYLIRVIATCSFGLTAEDISNDVFTISNIQTTTTTTETTRMSVPELISSFELFPTIIVVLAFSICIMRKRKG